MYVQAFPRGHHFKDKRPNVEKRAGALWELEAAHPGMEHFEKSIREKLKDEAGRALDLAASEPVNINVFPNLSLLGNHIQVIQPLAVDETDTTWYATAVNALRMRTQEAFPNFGEVDDAVNFEEIQRGLAACEDEWVYMHRGLGIPGRVREQADGTLKAPATDEVFMREHMKEWKRLMSSQPRLAITREP
jgi:hypothetical protein